MTRLLSPPQVLESKVDIFVCKAGDAACKTTEVKQGLEKPKWIVVERDPSDSQVRKQQTEAPFVETELPTCILVRESIPRNSKCLAESETQIPTLLVRRGIGLEKCKTIEVMLRSRCPGSMKRTHTKCRCTVDTPGPRGPAFSVLGACCRRTHADNLPNLSFDAESWKDFYSWQGIHQKVLFTWLKQNQPVAGEGSSRALQRHEAVELQHHERGLWGL